MFEDCKSWVFKKDSKICQLKNDYDPEKNVEDCADCISYNPHGSGYVFQSSYSTTTTITYSFSTDVSSWTESYFGKGSSWIQATGTETGMCLFDVGYDLSSETDLPEMPFSTNDAWDCCAKCTDTDGHVFTSREHFLSFV